MDMKMDPKSLAAGAAIIKVIEPLIEGPLIKALVAGLPKLIAKLLDLADGHPEVAKVLAAHREDFSSMFDAVAAAEKAALDKAAQAQAADAPKGA